MRRGTSIAAACMLLLGACGLEGEENARVIAIDDVDYELLGTTTSTTSTTVNDQPIFVVSLYWHTTGESRLRSIIRGKDSPPAPGATLLELVAGPTAAELEINPELQSRLDPSMEPELFQLDDGTYRIRIQQLADEALTTDQAAEFVCTITQFSDIDAVTIIDAEDVPFSLSGLGAVPIIGPARSSDFGDCIEEPVPGETTDGEEPDPGSSTTTGG
jgi:hypothetical protein